MPSEKLASGSDVIDGLLNGGLERGIITTVYGPSSSGKTNLALIFGASCAKQGKKVIYVDTEGGFSVERLNQIYPEHKVVLERFVFLRPNNFEELKTVIKNLKALVSESIGLIIVDSLAMPYRLEFSKGQVDIQEINREAGLLLSYLSETARKKNIPVLITNQVYSSFDDRDELKMVGGDLLKYASKCLIELKKFNSGVRKAVIKKHRSLPEDREITFRIQQTGFAEVKM